MKYTMSLFAHLHKMRNHSSVPGIGDTRLETALYFELEYVFFTEVLLYREVDGEDGGIIFIASKSRYERGFSCKVVSVF